MVFLSGRGRHTGLRRDGGSDGCSSDREARYSGKVGELAGRTSLSNTYGTVANVLVDIERDDIPDCRIGADVQAKIDCGKKSLAYVLFGDVVEFVQKRLW